MTLYAHGVQYGMPNDKTIPGFRRHGKPGNYRAGVLLKEHDAQAVADEVDADGATVSGVIRKAVRFYLASKGYVNADQA